jgi:hypothetical protein
MFLAMERTFDSEGSGTSGDSLEGIFDLHQLSAWREGGEREGVLGITHFDVSRRMGLIWSNAQGLQVRGRMRRGGEEELVLSEISCAWKIGLREKKKEASSLCTLSLSHFATHLSSLHHEAPRSTITFPLGYHVPLVSWRFLLLQGS